MNNKVTFCKSDRVYFYTKSLSSLQDSSLAGLKQNHFCEINLVQSSPINPETGMSASLSAVEDLITKIKDELLIHPLDRDPYFENNNKDLKIAAEVALIQFIQNKALKENISLHRIDISNSVEKFSIQYFPLTPENSVLKIELPLKIESGEVLLFPVESIHVIFQLDTLKSTPLNLDCPNPLLLENSDKPQNSKLKEFDFFYRIRDKMTMNPSPLQTEFILADRTIVKIV